MGTSSAFKELSEVLARLESSGTEVEHASVEQEFAEGDDDVTAELSVGVPLLRDAETSDAVSVEAEGATVEDGRVAVDLTVTVSAEAAASAGPTEAPTPGSGTPVAAYKDPEALRAVYEQHDTFPEMTEALDVEVTSETVRRHMVKYDIHDPSETAPHPYPQAAVDSDKTNAEDESTSPASESASAGSGESSVDARSKESADGDTGQNDTSSTREDPPTQSAVTDGGSRTVGAGPTAEPSPFATRTVGDVVGDDFAVDAGSVPESVTVGRLADVINGSRTVHELAETLGLSRGAAREFLQEFGLINFVAHPLATDQITVSPEEVVRRIDNATT